MGKLALILGLFLAQCTSTSDKETLISPHEAPLSDDAFIQALNQATQSANIYRDFETVLLIKVTYLSPHFRNAFAQRVKKLFQYFQPTFDDPKNKVGFFVSVYSPYNQKAELTNQNLWTILVEMHRNESSPLIIKKLDDKERWQPFFPYINKWTHEYFVLFEDPTLAPLDLTGPKSEAVKLKLSNAQTKIELSFNP